MIVGGLDRFTTAQVDVQNFALITHAVRADRVRPHVPDRFELQTFQDEGREMALVSASSFCNRQIHWSASRYPAHDFDQSTYRTYVVHKGRLGAFFFGSFVSTRSSYLAQKVVAQDTHLAEFDVQIEKSSLGYASYRSRAVCDIGELYFHIEARDQPRAIHPFETGEAHAQFITYRLHGYSYALTGGVSYGPIEHRHMDPWEGRLLDGRFDYWKRMDILTPEEAARPFSVLVEGGVRFVLHPPRPAG